MPLNEVAVLKCGPQSLHCRLHINGSTRLCDGFESYETVKEVRKKISDTGMSGRWQESSERTVKSDPRPAYKFLMLAGPFRLSGVEGSREADLLQRSFNVH